jgi:hypothetical protein
LLVTIGARLQLLIWIGSGRLQPWNNVQKITRRRSWCRRRRTHVTSSSTVTCTVTHEPRTSSCMAVQIKRLTGLKSVSSPCFTQRTQTTSRSLAAVSRSRKQEKVVHVWSCGRNSTSSTVSLLNLHS